MKHNRIIFLLLALAFLLVACEKAEATEASEEISLDSLTFLGDSITAHMALRSEVPREHVWCTKERYLNLDSRITYAKIVAPDTGEEETIASVAARLRPKNLVITLGIDYGVYYYRNDLDTFSHYYEKLIDTILASSPETNVILQSILPVTKDCHPITNKMINNANTTVRAIAEHRSLLYLDTASVLRDEEGCLKRSFCNSEDGIHLNEEAYEKMLTYITTRVTRARGAA